MRKVFLKRKITSMPRQQLWMLLSFALYTKNEELTQRVQDEVKQRDFLGVR